MNEANRPTSKFVAVSQRVDVVENRGERRDALDQRLASFLSVIGLTPVMVPNQLINTTPGLPIWLDRFDFSGVVLSGGNNIGDHPERDSTESSLLEFAKRNGLPVLGICRGMQMMAEWSGGSLIRVEGHVRTRHLLTGEINANVNSYHDYALSECPEGFEVLARAEDGSIEAIRHSVLKWQGWMWHPERESEFASHDIERISRLFGE